MLFGAPGVGKGTFGKLIQRDFDFKAFSTGDYFRQVVKMA
jgi:adenylate kinase family enzyme